jgi:hypothetical protein
MNDGEVASCNGDVEGYVGKYLSGGTYQYLSLEREDIFSRFSLYYLNIVSLNSFVPLSLYVLTCCISFKTSLT